MIRLYEQWLVQSTSEKDTARFLWKSWARQIWLNFGMHVDIDLLNISYHGTALVRPLLLTALVRPLLDRPCSTTP